MNFNFKTPAEKEFFVKNLFDRISSYYDYMNDLITFGLHRTWKKQACKLLNLNSSHDRKLLDLACGSGDIAFYLEKIYPEASITGVDFSPKMLEIAEKKAKKKSSKVNFIQGDALNLPFEKDFFDGAIISYGLRNMSDYGACLKELNRVIKPNGKLIILELSHPEGFVKTMTSIYRFKILPMLGMLFAKDHNAYSYLPNSIMNYPRPEELIEIMKKNGWEKEVSYKVIFGGVCAIHRGTK